MTIKTHKMWSLLMSFCAAETIRIQEQDKSIGGVVQNDEASFGG